jgi:hypothetical protein
LTISIADLKVLKSLIEFNARSTQPLSDPFDAAWSKMRVSDYFPEGAPPVVDAAGGH